MTNLVKLIQEAYQQGKEDSDAEWSFKIAYAELQGFERGSVHGFNSALSTSASSAELNKAYENGKTQGIARGRRQVLAELSSHIKCKQDK